jgi:hypothetical protein
MLSPWAKKTITNWLERWPFIMIAYLLFRVTVSQFAGSWMRSLPIRGSPSGSLKRDGIALIETSDRAIVVIVGEAMPDVIISRVRNRTKMTETKIVAYEISWFTCSC